MMKLVLLMLRVNTVMFYCARGLFPDWFKSPDIWMAYRDEFIDVCEDWRCAWRHDWCEESLPRGGDGNLAT